MKSIDTKSLLIGALLTSTIFLGVAAYTPHNSTSLRGWAIGGVTCTANGGTVFLTDAKGLHRSQDRGKTWETLLKAEERRFDTIDALINKGDPTKK